jgi:FAD/FMN-containing dehydrogenase
MDYGPLLGAGTAAGTIGGTLSANLSGPRRIKAGAARDHFLGVSAVSGRGETFKSGGRVVKNVTGYDLCKLLAGSWGTLAVMTDVTIKTLPRAETEATVLALGLDDAAGGKVMAAVMGSFADACGASAGFARYAHRRCGFRARRRYGVPPRRRRSFSHPPQRSAGKAYRAFRRPWLTRRSGLARAVAGDPRR